MSNENIPKGELIPQTVENLQEIMARDAVTIEAQAKRITAFETLVSKNLRKVVRCRLQVQELQWKLEVLQKIVNEQTADEGLWFRHCPPGELYHQQELRRLHAAIEGE